MKPDELSISNTSYKYLGLAFVLICIAVAAYPIWVIAMWLADFLNIPDDVPVKEQENGWLWVGLFLSEAALIFTSVYWVLAQSVARHLKWSKQLYIKFFWTLN